MISLQQIAEKIKTDKKYWIVFTGDSITSCEWVHPNWREIVEYVLKEELTKELDAWKPASWSIRTFNFAYDGATTTDILEKVDLMKLAQPDLAISVMGSNDYRNGIDVSTHVENIKSIVNKLDTKVVWCTSIPTADKDEDKNYDQYAKDNMKLAEKENLQLVDLFTLYRQFPREKFFTFKHEGNPDPLHPNQLGNAYIAKIILREVFSIEFDPEKYITDTLAGEKYPSF